MNKIITAILIVISVSAVSVVPAGAVYTPTYQPPSDGSDIDDIPVVVVD